MRTHQNMQLDLGRMEELLVPAPGAFGCPNCNFVTSLIDQFEIHINMVSTMCDLCGKQCCSEVNLKGHMKIECDLAKSCPLCDKPVTTLRIHLYIYHQMKHNGSKNFPCFNCGKKFKRKSDVHRHNSRVHLCILDHPCDICGKRFGDNKDMVRHRDAVHNGKKVNISKWKQRIESTRNMDVQLEDGHEVDRDQFVKEEQGFCMQQQGQGASMRVDMQKQGHFKRQDGIVQGHGVYHEGKEGDIQGIGEEHAQRLDTTEDNKHTQWDFLTKKESILQHNAVQEFQDDHSVTEQDEVLSKRLKEESIRFRKSETNPNKNNSEKQDDDIFVIAQEEPVQCNLCSFKLINSEALKVHKNITHGPKCLHCNFRFKDTEKLKKHITISHTDKTPSLKD